MHRTARFEYCAHQARIFAICRSLGNTNIQMVLQSSQIKLCRMYYHLKKGNRSKKESGVIKCYLSNILTAYWSSIFFAFITQPVGSFQVLHYDKKTVCIVQFPTRVTVNHANVYSTTGPNGNAVQYFGGSCMG